MTNHSMQELSLIDPRDTFMAFMANRAKLIDRGVIPSSTGPVAKETHAKATPQLRIIAQDIARADKNDPFIAQRVMKDYKLGIATGDDYAVSFMRERHSYIAADTKNVVEFTLPRPIKQRRV